MNEELKQAAQQALEAWQTSCYGQPAHQRAMLFAMTELGKMLEGKRALTASQPAQAGCNHVLYETADADRPKEICDQNGEVVLAMCKLCGKAESELEATQPAAQATPEPVQLDVVRQAIEDRDAMESRYHDLAHNLTYQGNSVAWWHSKATAYRNAIDEVWSALKVAGIRADGTKTCADGVRELAATPEPVGEPALWVPTKQLDQRETTTRGYLWFSNPQNDSWTPLYTHPAPGVPEVDYSALIHAAWGKHKYAQGTGGCIAFKRGAEWFRDIALAAAQAKGADHV